MVSEDELEKLAFKLQYLGPEEIRRELAVYVASNERLANFRAHAVTMRDEGATHVSVDSMSVTFGPRPSQLTDQMLAALVTEKAIAKEPEPVGDEDYVP